MPAKRKFDAQMEALDALRTESAEQAEPAIKAALALRNNFLVAKAANLTLHHRLIHLAPDLAAAFPRFLEDAAKTDPQCWAKHALVKTLAAFDYQPPEIFLAGMRHIQMEPVWGGTADSAGPLRGASALALVQCRDVSSHDVLRHLTALLADKGLQVQVNAARAMVQVGTDSAALLLRLRAELGSGEAELLGTCYAGVLELEGTSAIPWAAHFLAQGDDAAAEAALAIAQTHAVEAFEALQAAFKPCRDPWFCSTLLSAIALTRRTEAVAWLLALIEREERHADAAVEALCRAVPSAETVARLRELGRACPE